MKYIDKIEKNEIPMINWIKHAGDKICDIEFKSKDTKPIIIKEINTNNFDFKISIKFIKT